MRPNMLKAALMKSGLAASVLLLANGTALAQTTPQQLNLVAAPTTYQAPDGSVIPMWGYFCGATTTTQSTAVTATCAASNPASVTTAPAPLAAAVGTWSPVVITIPYTFTSATSTAGVTTTTSTTTLQINLANHLLFTAGAGTNPIPTSLTILGQLGGGLGGTNATCVNTTVTPNVQQGGTACSPSPVHSTMTGNTWSTTIGTTDAFAPPPQGPRVRSFGTEVAATLPPASGAPDTYTNLCFGNCAAGQPGLLPGTYLIESGTHPAIQGSMGLYGVLIVTDAPSATPIAPATAALGCAYVAPSTTGTTAACAVPYSAEVPVVMGEIDPVQNGQVAAAVATAGFSEANPWSGAPGACGNPLTSAGAANTAFLTCYPPTANYTPLYYTINGVAFDRTHAPNSLFPAKAGTASTGIATTGTVLVRLVNAGSRMHVPSMVGEQTNVTTPAGGTGPTGVLNSGTAAVTTAVPGFSLVGEDGNLMPGLPKVQSDVFMAAGKTFDTLINVTSTTQTTAFAIFDRELSLSGNGSERDAGMLAYIGVNSSAEPAAAAIIAAATAVKANADTYNSLLPCPVATPQPPCTPVVVSDPGKGVIANDVGVYGVTLFTAPTTAVGTVVLNHNGTFTFTPAPGFTGSATTAAFAYCANGSLVTTTSGTPPTTTTTCSSGKTASVFIGPNSTADGTITLGTNVFKSNTNTYLLTRNPGLLIGATDSAGYPLSLVSATSPGLTVTTDPLGGFSAVPATGTTGTITCPASAGTLPTGTRCYSVSYSVKSAHGTTVASAGAAGATGATAALLIFLPANGVTFTVEDPYTKASITDYRWLIEEDRTFYVDPACTTNPPPAGCPGFGTATAGIVPTFGVNFHTSDMPVIAQGCTGPLSCEAGQTQYDQATGLHRPVICDVGDGQCRVDPNNSGDLTNTTGGGAYLTTGGSPRVDPSQVYLDPTRRYYISVLPGDAANPFEFGSTGANAPCIPFTNQAGAAQPSNCGHGMGGAQIPAVRCAPNATNSGNVCSFTSIGATAMATCTTTSTTATCIPTGMSVTALTQPSPYPPGRLSVMVFEDDFPLNGEQDSGGGIDVLALNEPGLGGFQIHLWDEAGTSGDFTGQMTYDMFNMPLTNSLDGTVDPNTGLNACPITQIGMNNPGTNATAGPVGSGGASTTAGISGMIVTCPKFEADNVTLSPLAGQAVVSNLMPGRWGVIATPGADRIARGEEWLQTNSLDGQKAHDAFTRIGEPSYFQEYGPAGYHVSIGFANPAIINSRLSGVCNGTDANVTGTNCANTLTGRVVAERMSRSPDERLYGSGSHDAFAWTQCFVSFGDTDGEDFAFAKCNADGTFTLSGLPDGNWRLTIFDQWNDILVDGLATPVLLGGGKTINLGDIAMNQWQANLYTRTFIDDNKDGVFQSTETGIPLVPVSVRFRDGSLTNTLNTDFNGVANFNETFPLFNWYVVETDTTRYKATGTHVVYDAGGPADGSSSCGSTGYPACGTSTIGRFLARTYDDNPLPANLSVPGAVYCSNADCTGFTIASGPVRSSASNHSTGRIDPPWVGVEGWQGFSGQSNFLEFGKSTYAPATATTAGENGGIKGHVIYASTRPFDDPVMLVQTQWEPLVAHVTINLYQEGFETDGVTPSLKLVDTTQTSSFDDWAQGFRSDGIPNMNCPGQSTADLFYFTLYNQPEYLDLYNNQHSGTPQHTVPYNSQYKCYDGMHDWNQLQPAPYDGMYTFPSVLGRDPVTGRLTTASGSVNGTPSSMPGTNCTICIPNPDATDPYRYRTPMLPSGKFVVEVVLPPGYELVKEEDKNILIGDNFIAPAVQEFAGNTNVFIIPDQASVASAMAPAGTSYTLFTPNYAGPGYNPNTNSAGNGNNPTVSLGATPQNGIVPAFVPEPTWPCVGEVRIVPDYISLYPQSRQMSPFAGATRPLCDRKEVTLTDQMGAIAKFYIYTSTHRASKFAGVITDDFTSEFDPFSPQFGEKFSPPNLPVSIKDWTGTEISRIYSDQWGMYNGLTYSTWEVNPPNPTGYSPTMMVTCMNDAGPIVGPAGTMISDPLYNSAYSQFCYEISFMPGATQYMDTPVIPTSAFAGAGYNNPDCGYPTLTPAISEVDGDGIGPWVSAANRALTIDALGDQVVANYGYSGPSATTAPFNQKSVTRHYGFGTSTGTVSIGGIQATVGSWSDTQIVVTVPTGVPPCPVPQQAQYAGTAAQCGELVITTAPPAGSPAGAQGMRSVDTVTVTIGGKAPTHVAATASVQHAIDIAAPGDLLILDPATQATATAPAVPAIHREMLLMWKPVRLQGVAAASSIIDANPHPAGKLDAWRRQVNCLFELALNGQPLNEGTDITFPAPSGSPSAPLTLKHNPYDPSKTYTCPGAGWTNFSGMANSPQVDRLPLEGTLGWDTTINGNLAELLQEPSLMGAYEGAGITVLSKGVLYPPNTNVFGNFVDTAAGSFLAHEGQMPVPTIELAAFPDGTSYCTAGAGGLNPFPSNFRCNPSRIDGLTVTNSSQGGGGIYVHGWAHNLEISNNRVTNNTGTMSGGITIGQGESPDAILANNNGDPVGYNGGTLAAFDQQPWTCVPGSVVFTSATPFGYDQVANPPNTVPNQQLPYCYNINVNLHNNAITKNSSIGDELFAATPAGAGGVTLCTGSDYYKFNYNWVCGNLSPGDGGGVSHAGFSWYGDIEHNTVIFNQSTNPTIPTNGGGIVVMGAAPDGSPTVPTPGVTECGSVTDIDCGPGLSDGTGPGLVINANLIMGNAAESGSGGGLRLQDVNGTEVAFFATNPAMWNSVSVTNNIIVNNVSGWDGAGVSLQDALNTNVINNTIMSNDSTASSGVLFNTLGAPLASSPGATNQTTSATTSAPQPAGVSTSRNTSLLTASLPATVICPTGHGPGGTGTGGLTNGACRNFSYPLLSNNIIWQNRSFFIGVGALGTGTQNQQHVVSLYNAFSTTAAASQTATGQCVSGSSYWDIGARGDTGPSNHLSGVTLAPTYSVLTDVADYPGLNNSGANPAVVSQYCNGARVPPEFKSMGYQVPPGISDATMPNPIFNLTPTATVDEGNNWINMSWGPLSLTNPSVKAANGNYGSGPLLGNYTLATGSPAIDYIPTASGSGALAPASDFYGNPRPDPANPNRIDVGAVEK